MKTLPHLRWWICGLLCFATTINYLDRTALSVLKETLVKEFELTDNDYANIVIGFMVAYAIGQMFAGRFIDYVGTRRGYLFAFLFWTAASMAHALAGSAAGFTFCRVLLGICEAGNFPASIKAVSEWFPAKERALATGILNTGSGIGAMIAPWIIFVIMSPTMLGLGWREAFIGTGAIGLIWVVFWLALYRPPAAHPLLSPEERAHIESGRTEVEQPNGASMPWSQLLSYRQVWGMMLARFFSDPVWWFWVFWFPGYLQKHRNFSLEELAAFAWIPFFASDFGSLSGGALSTYFAHRSNSIIKARTRALMCCAALMPLTIWAGLTSSATVVIVVVSIAAVAHQAWSASLLTLPADVFPSRYVGSVYGLTAMAGGIGGIIFTKLVGYVSTEYKTFVPMFIAAGVMHLIGVTLAKTLVREPVSFQSA